MNDLTDDQKVWRYMSFSRFVWLLRFKQLWMARVDLLGDPWEMALAGGQLAHVLTMLPLAVRSDWLTGRRLHDDLESGSARKRRRCAMTVGAGRSLTYFFTVSEAHPRRKALAGVFRRSPLHTSKQRP
jgi:hypothetical protein